MSVFTSLPFNYVFDDLIRIKATSTNFFGTAVFSQINTVGAKVRQVPDKMSQPFLVTRTKTTMTVRWNILNAPATGNSNILSYNLFWNNGNGDLTTQLVDSLVTDYSLTGLIGGTIYSF